MHSGANEGKTDGDLGQMGLRMSQEIFSFIQDNCPDDKLAKISFIGYSLGGVIIRAALPYLHNLRDKFESYVSLCSPHLGYLYKKGKLFSTGMWIMNNINESTVISQLRYTDGNSVKDSYLYRLSMQEGLDWFQNILLVSSSQDEWAPYESARMQITN